MATPSLARSPFVFKRWKEYPHENADEKTREIYKAYQVKNFGKINYGPAVERKHAIVDYFEHNAKGLHLY